MLHLRAVSGAAARRARRRRLPRARDRAGAVSALLLALLTLWAVACDEGRTYYPVVFCNKLCEDEINATGHPHKRAALVFPEERYNALPAQQDVIRSAGDIIESLTRDKHLECHVLNQCNWYCLGNTFATSTGIPESYDMTDCELVSNRFIVNEQGYKAGNVPKQDLEYRSWWRWMMVQWHNDMIDEDDTPPH